MSVPQSLEPPTSNPRVSGGVARVTMAEVVLRRSKVRAAIGQRVATRVAQHVRPDMPELGALACLGDEVIDGLARELRALSGERLSGSCCRHPNQPHYYRHPKYHFDKFLFFRHSLGSSSSGVICQTGCLQHEHERNAPPWLNM